MKPLLVERVILDVERQAVVQNDGKSRVKRWFVPRIQHEVVMHLKRDAHLRRGEDVPVHFGYPRRTVFAVRVVYVPGVRPRVRVLTHFFGPIQPSRREFAHVLPVHHRETAHLLRLFHVSHARLHSHVILRFGPDQVPILRAHRRSSSHAE